MTEQQKQQNDFIIKIGIVKDLMDHGYDSASVIAVIMKESVSEIKRCMEIVNLAGMNKATE